MLWLAYRALTSPLHRAYNRARAEVGLPHDPRPYGRVLFSDWLVMATGCPSLDVPRPNLPSVVHFVGRLAPAGLAYSEPTDGVEATSSTRPLVVVTQGTSDVDPAELIRPALFGLADLDVDVIATTGQQGRQDVGLTPPSNARVVDFVDFARVLPTTAVLVTNGGWGGVLGSLAAGVPLVVAPGGAADKPEICRRVARSGVGINLRRRYAKPESIATAVAEVLVDPAYGRRARELGSELERLGGTCTASDLLERLAQSGAPVRRTADPWPTSARG